MEYRPAWFETTLKPKPVSSKIPSGTFHGLDASDLAKVSPQQRKCVAMHAAGMTIEQIADALVITSAHVRMQLVRAKDKLGLTAEADKPATHYDAPAGADISFGDLMENARSVTYHGPETAMQALMEAAPGSDPEESTEERAAREDSFTAELIDALNGMTEKQRAVAFLLMEGKSQSEAADYLGLHRQSVNRMVNEQLARSLAPVMAARYGR